MAIRVERGHGPDFLLMTIRTVGGNRLAGRDTSQSHVKTPIYGLAR